MKADAPTVTKQQDKTRLNIRESQKMSSFSRAVFPSTPPLLSSPLPALYITVGPPCCGKTTWLRHQPFPINDIALDDQAGVYHPVSTLQYLKMIDADCVEMDTVQKSAKAGVERPSASGAGHLSLIEPPNDLNPCNDTLLFGKTLHERVQLQVELNLILLRLSNKLTASSFAEQLQSYYKTSGFSMSTTHLDIWIQVIEDEILAATRSDNTGKSVKKGSQNVSFSLLPNVIDIYIWEALFRASSLKNMSAIEQANQLLDEACQYNSIDFSNKNATVKAVALGNTNTRPFEYQRALQVAQQTGRSIYFILYNPFYELKNCSEHQNLSQESAGNRPTLGPPSLFDLPHVPFADLLKRNLARFLQTGRFIPACILYDMNQRTKDLLRDVVKAAKTDGILPIVGTGDAEVTPANGDNCNIDSSDRKIIDINNNTKQTALVDDSAVITALQKLSKFQLDQLLVRLAKFDLHADRAVSKLTLQHGKRQTPCTDSKIAKRRKLSE